MIQMDERKRKGRGERGNEKRGKGGEEGWKQRREGEEGGRTLPSAVKLLLFTHSFKELDMLAEAGVRVGLDRWLSG